MGESERESGGASASPLSGRERRPRRRAGRWHRRRQRPRWRSSHPRPFCFVSAVTRGCQMPISNRCIKVNLEGDGTFMRGLRPAPIQPMSEASMAEMPEEPVCSQGMSMSFKPGGKPTKPLYPSTIKFPGFLQNSDSPRSTGSFSKCGPWTLGSSACNRHKKKRQIQARWKIELCKKKRESESEGLCM
jgi:hypothetical protein